MVIFSQLPETVGPVSTLTSSIYTRRTPVKRFILSLSLAVLWFAQRPVAQAQELTLENIFAPNGITGRGPDTVKWSPDGKKVSYMVHAEQGEKADLYYVDAASGKPAVLVSAEKIAAMAPRQSGTKDDRERDNRARYHVAGYHWAPDSQHILFDANGQLWYYTVATGTAGRFKLAAASCGGPKFFSARERLAYVRPQ